MSRKTNSTTPNAKKREGTLFPSSHATIDTTPIYYASFQYSSITLKDNPFFQKVKKDLAGDKKTLKNVFAASLDLLKTPKNAKLYNEQCAKNAWKHISAMEELNKTRRHMYVFDLADVLCGLPFGHAFADDQLRNAMINLGARRKNIPNLGVWRHEVSNTLIMNVIKPMWEQAAGYNNLPGSILDTAAELHTVSNNYWIVKADTEQRLDECRSFGLRCMPQYKSVIQSAKKLSQIKAQRDFVNWTTDCWKFRGSPIWWQKEDDKFPTDRLSTIMPTIRFTVGK